jgi:hypothetical protein
MPDVSTSNKDPENSADAAEPPAIEADDDELQTVIDRLPAAYVLRREVICRRHDRGTSKPLCGPILVSAEARGADGTGWYTQVRFRSKEGAWREVVVASKDLASTSGGFVSGLIDQGFDVFGRPREVSDLLRLMKVDAFRKAVNVTGWAGDRFDTYVCPSGAVLERAAGQGAPESTEVLFTGKARVRAKSRGAAQDWCEALKPVQSNEAVLIGLCAGIAPIFLPATRNPSFLLHIFGNEDAAKVSSQVASSVWGPTGGLALSWKEPEKTLVSEISAARDGLVILTGYSPRHVGKLAAIVEAMEAMETVGGAGGRVVILSTGYEPLLLVKDRPQTRVNLRNVIDIHAGQWDVNDTDESVAAAFLASGSFGPAVVQAAMAWGLRGSHADSLSIRCEDILDALGNQRGQVDAETQRAANAFGALYGAGKFAAKRDLLAVPAAHQLAVFQKFFLDWVGRNSGLLSVADRGLLAAVADELSELSATGALVSLNGIGGTVSAEAIGWQDPEWFYLSGQLVSQIAAAQGVRFERVVELLLAQGLLQPDGEKGNKFRLPSRVPGRPRAYRISPEALRFASAAPAAVLPADPDDAG